MKTLHYTTNMVPGVPRFSLRDAHQHERQETEKHMRLDAFILPMMNGPQIQGRFQGAEGPLHLQKLLVPQGDVFRGQAVVTGGEDVLPIQMRLLPDLALVDLDASVLELPEVSPKRPVSQKRANALLGDFPF